MCFFFFFVKCIRNFFVNTAINFASVPFVSFMGSIRTPYPCYTHTHTQPITMRWRAVVDIANLLSEYLVSIHLPRARTRCCVIRACENPVAFDELPTLNTKYELYAFTRARTTIRARGVEFANLWLDVPCGYDE